MSQFKNVLRTFQPDVIHIQSAFKEIASTGQIYLDLGNETFDMRRGSPIDSPRFQQASPSLLNDALSATQSSKLRPLVILDATCPQGLTEAIHQLIYRNAFATELFNHGNVSGVIAMGLGRKADLYNRQTAQLISDMSNTVTLGEIVNGLRKPERGSLRKPSKLDYIADKIPTSGVALFTNEPWITVLSPEHH